MENELKKLIDKVKKQNLKERLENVNDSVNKKQIQESNAEEFEYGRFLKRILDVNSGDSYFPFSDDSYFLFQLLTVEVLYKQSFKSACDVNHPILLEVMQDMKMDEKDARYCIEKAKYFEAEKLDYFTLFEEEITGTSLNLDPILAKIDQLSADAKQGTIISHAAKMSNPNCRYPKIFVDGRKANDGFVRTGNSPVQFDMHVNATKLKVYKFLALTFKGIPILEYIKAKDSSVFIQVFNVTESKASEWIEGFSQCLSSFDYRTDRFIRQLYFPVNDNYHLLSVLQPSGLVFSLKERIDYQSTRSPEAYTGNKLRRDGKYFAQSLVSFPKLTVTKHGGDHPKNISGLNNKYQSYYLLNSSPPPLQKRKIRFPKKNFFGESFTLYDCNDVMEALQKLILTNYNNVNIREGRDYRIQELFDRIVYKMLLVRSVSHEQFKEDRSKLKAHQRVWLCESESEQRESGDEWLATVIKETSLWIFRTYKKKFGSNNKTLGDDFLKQIQKIVEDNREVLR